MYDVSAGVGLLANAVDYYNNFYYFLVLIYDLYLPIF
jgi:hypothetical protein